MNQKEFCEREGIPESRMSNIINGTRRADRYRKKIMQALDIEDDPPLKKAE